MPIPLVAEVLDGGLAKIPYAYTILKTIPWIVLIYLLKLYFGGTSNRSERVLHSKVIMMTVCSPWNGKYFNVTKLNIGRNFRNRSSNSTGTGFSRCAIDSSNPARFE